MFRRLVHKLGIFNSIAVLSVTAAALSALLYFSVSSLLGAFSPVGIVVSIVAPLVVAPIVAQPPMKLLVQLERAEDALQQSHDELEQRVAERTTQISEQLEQLGRQAQIFASLQDAVIVTDPEGLIVDWNPAATAMYGYSREEMLGQTAEILNEPDADASLTSRILTAVSQEQSWTGDIRFVRKDGSKGVSRTIVAPLLDQEGRATALMGVNRDITEQMRASQEREDLIDQLQEALAHVKTLSGLLPICSSCKRVRDDQGYWHQVESYVRDHSEAEFSHSICPDCATRLYPDLYQPEQKNEE
jgi:PAS domain S-box-containing protein